MELQPVWKFVIGFAVLIAGVSLAQTNKIDAGKPPSSPVATAFIADANLSAGEIKQVVDLALQCGIPDVDRVETFQYLPSSARGISVTSKERKAGRNVSYDTVQVNRVDWGWPVVDHQAKVLGPFWVNPPYKGTTLQREFEIEKKTVRIIIGKGIDTAFADRVIPLITSKQVRFPGDWSRVEFDKLDLAKPTMLSKSLSDEDYELHFAGREFGMRVLRFKMEKGQVVITGVGHINI